MGWELITVENLDAELLSALFENRIAGIRVPDFLDQQALRNAVCGIEREGMDYYTDVKPPIGRIGITQFEHRQNERQMADYFAATPAASARRDQLFADGVDPLKLVIKSLRAVWPHQVDLAKEPDSRVYFAGLVRHISLGLLHCDWAGLDAPSWAISKITAQITWNIYCQVPGEGGSTVIYNRPWDESAESHAIEDSYGYSDDVVVGSRSVRSEPRAGDLVLFNPRNFHRIESNTGARRLTVGSFVGRQPGGDLVLWS